MLQEALKKVAEQEYIAWVNWQAVSAQVERLGKLLAALEGS